MPEGPEVRRVYEDLSRELVGKTVTALEVLGGRFEKKPPVGYRPLDMPTSVIGGGVKGKFMWIEFGDRSTMWMTLGMSGYWSSTNQKHAHFRIEYHDSGETKNLYFVDQRRFGTIRFSEDRSELEKKLSTLGLDLLTEDHSLSKFEQVLRKKSNRTVCEVLMDQRVLAGVGNYIKCEVLYRSRISPFRKVIDLNAIDVKNLYSWTKKIIRASYLQGGASIRNYRRVNGELGNFVFEFEVYAQKTDPLGNQVIREETPDKRTTHWVPSQQS